MKSPIRTFGTFFATITALALSWPALAQDGGRWEGVFFPKGAISFADYVVAYEPDYGGGPEPDITQQDSFQVLGIPAAGEISLGNGGRIVVSFIDNFLTGSNTPEPDLWIFEVGAPEFVHVEISWNGRYWYPVGMTNANATGIDIDRFGYGANRKFRFVRLTDDGDSPVKGWTGADIVAVGASSTIERDNQLHQIKYWIQAHIGGVSELVLRGNDVWWHHIKGTAPGLERKLGMNANTPTIIDSNFGPNINWTPEGWPERLGNYTHPESWSATFDGLTPALPKREWCWELKKTTGVGPVAITRQPNARNGYSMVIKFNDLSKPNVRHQTGSGFYRIELTTTGEPCR